MKQKLLPKSFLFLFFSMMLYSGSGNAQCDDLTQTTPNIGRFDYTMWSSPVSGFTLDQLSPKTLNDKYFIFDPLINNWANVDSTTVMQAGKGYLVRGPNDYYPYDPNHLGPKPYIAPFAGAAHSGPIGVPIVVSALTGTNLIGNPYCSAIMADCFIRDAGNQNSVNGTLYFWTHNVPIDWTDGTSNPPNPQVDGIYNYNTSSYAAYNLLGGVAAGYTSNGSAFLTLDRPDGYIARAQGFMVSGLSNGSTAHFEEYMRIGYPAHFFKNGEPEAVPPPASCDVNRHRIWLQIRMGTLFKETLVGYANNTDGATTGPGLDRNFDGLLLPPSAGPAYIHIYSLSPGSTSRLTIQGRALSSPFNVNDVIALGYDSNTSGTATITGSDYDGLFGLQDYWLKETIGTNPPTYHHIKTTPYTFSVTANPTDANTRFQIVFKIPNTPVLIPRETSCGGTLPSIWSQLQAYPYTMPAYSYKIVDLDTNTLVGYFNGQGTVIYTVILNQPGIHFGGHYAVSAATFKIDGDWVYGEACNVFTPPAPPTINSCSGNSAPITISGYSNSIFVTNNYTFFNLLKGSIYRYRLTNLTTNVTTVIEKNWTVPNPYPYRLSLNEMTASYATNPQTPQPSTNYTLEVDVFWNGAWIGYGFACNYVTTANPTQKTLLSNEFSANVYPNPFANSFKIDVTTDSNETVEAVVYDMIGRQIEIFKLNANELNNQEIGIKYPSGIYNIVVKQGDNVQSLRAVKK